MTSYRLYCLDDGGRIGLAEWFDAANDEHAIEQAQILKRGARICEVWHCDSLVATLGSKELGVPPSQSDSIPNVAALS